MSATCKTRRRRRRLLAPGCGPALVGRPSACVVRGGAAAAEAAPQPVAISRLPTCCTARRGPGWKRPLALAPRRRLRLPALRRSGGRARAGMRGRKGRRGATFGVARRPDETGRGAPPRFGVPEAARSAAQRPGTGRSSREPNPRRGEARGRRPTLSCSINYSWLCVQGSLQTRGLAIRADNILLPVISRKNFTS